MCARIRSGMLAHCHLSHSISPMLPPPLYFPTLYNLLPIGSKTWLEAHGRPGGLPDTFFLLQPLGYVPTPFP